MHTAASLAPDPWLSGLLGTPAFTLRGFDDPAAVATALPEGSSFVTAKVPTQPADAAIALQDSGFRVIDTALTFTADGLDAPEDDPRVRPAMPGDAEAVTAVAGSAFRCSRFHLDPEIPDGTADRIKAAWAGNYFTGLRGDGMLVAEDDAGGVAGFLQLLRTDDGGLVIDLIAVAEKAARRGLARAMIGNAARHGLDGTRPSSLAVGTQAANLASCRLYESLGFRLAKSAFVLHCHTRTRRSSPVPPSNGSS